MSNKLSEYLVLEILGTGNFGEACYKVRHKLTNSLLIWKAYDCKKYTSEQLNNITNEVKLLKKLNNEFVIKYFDTILHSLTSTLYVVTDLHPDQNLSELIAKCEIENKRFEESFIWSILYQVSSASKAISEININILQKHIKSSNVYVSSKFKVKVEPFFLCSLQDSPVKGFCLNEVCTIGSILFEMCTLSKYKSADSDARFIYSEDLQNILNILVHNSERKTACDLKPDVILHHPTVALNLITEPQQMFFQSSAVSPQPSQNNDSAFESDESLPKIKRSLSKSLSLEDISLLGSPKFCDTSNNIGLLESKPILNYVEKRTLNNQLSPTLVALDLKIPGYVPQKVSEHVKKWRSRLELCKDPEEVSEEALSAVWFQRLAALRDREEAVRLKEREINKKKVFQEVASKFGKEIEPPKLNVTNDSAKSMTGITLQSAMAQKVFNDNISAPPPISKIYHSSKQRKSLSDGSVISDKSQSSTSRRSYRRSSSVRTRYHKKSQMSYEDLDSSLSADPGDTSILPTSKKISSNIPRPKSIYSIPRRKVHFNPNNNPFAEYDSVSSTTLTFFEIENFNASYEVPVSRPAPYESVADRIAKFTYLDLEAMTNKKRALMEEMRKTPPKINRSTKPTLQSKIKAAENLKKFSSAKNNEMDNRTNRNILNPIGTLPYRPPSASSRTSGCSSKSGGSFKSVSSFSSTKDERRKTIAPLIVDIDFESDSKFPDGNKENVTPVPKLKKDSKRRSIMGFKTPFKFKL